ncbi:MAG: flagellar biosynthetic protein FliO [Myxococcales bacterium]|nr:flagellar biosynthetic protein FliO [Myxococcales bacterium]
MERWLLLSVLLLSALAVAEADAGLDAGRPDVTTTAVEASQPLVAEPEIPVSEPPELLRESETDLGWSLVRTFVVLGLVIGLAWLTLNVGLRRLMGLGPATGRRGIVTVVERVPLDQKRTLYVVRAGDEVLLLGGSDLSVTFLTKLDAKVIEESAPKSTGQVSLSPFLQKLLGKKDAPPPPPAT